MPNVGGNERASTIQYQWECPMPNMVQTWKKLIKQKTKHMWWECPMPNVGVESGGGNERVLYSTWKDIEEI